MSAPVLPVQLFSVELNPKSGVAENTVVDLRDHMLIAAKDFDAKVMEKHALFDAMSSQGITDPSKMVKVKMAMDDYTQGIVFMKRMVDQATSSLELLMKS